MKIFGFASGKREFERKCSCLMDGIGLICRTVGCVGYRQGRAYVYALWHKSANSLVDIGRIKWSIANNFLSNIYNNG